MEGLGQVNLLVGTNNSGKTSILECIELLRSPGNPHVLASIVGRRGEWGYTADEDVRTSLVYQNPLDVRHLFANRELPGAIAIEADDVPDPHVARWNDGVTIDAREIEELDWETHDVEENHRFALEVKWSQAQDAYRAFVTEQGFLFGPRRLMRERKRSIDSVEFVTTRGVTAADVVRTYSRFVLTPKDEAITEALRIVAPAVERIAPTLNERGTSGRDAPGGVKVKLRELPDPVPIGSMGDGMWRILGLALSMARASGGILLVDEIDTGLHYSVMEDVWRMISERASALAVQVFATTHSRDCYESLAAVARTEFGDVTIQRIEKSRDEAVRFSKSAIVAAAERNIEVR
jgi:energy-coupling factor transporter ATP-binding protein EcfA2